MIESKIPIRDDSPLAVLVSIAVRNDDILHQTDRKTGLSAVHTYMLASYNSNAITNLMKIQNCIKWEIMVRVDNREQFIPQIIPLRDRVKEVIRASRANDPNLDLVLGQI